MYLKLLHLLKPSLNSLKVFVTDGEPNVYEAFRSCFTKVQYLLCWIHVVDNIKNKLSSLHAEDPSRYIEEISGKKCGSLKVKGLLDATCDMDFEEEWKRLESVWKQREKSGCEFLSYLLQDKKKLMKN